jgi:transposase InsO family protein
MSNPIHPVALFRLSVLGPLASRSGLKRGEATTIIRELASIHYDIPDSKRTHLSEDTIARWHTLWKRGGIDALNPKIRRDKGKTQLPLAVQDALLGYKKDNPSRSINRLIDLIERAGLVSKKTLSRASVHRFLQQQKASKRILGDINTIERRSFVAEHAGDIWQGDVLHGPTIQTPDGLRKTYLVSLMDDASRLIAHSAFCFGETALDIEGVLKQALLKRGLPYKIIIDNGPAYRAGSLQNICARLEIRLVYSRAYEPQSKGKLERYHRTFREQFLDEIDMSKITDLGDLNARLWAWVEQVYHTRPHGGLDGKQTPIARWRDDLTHVRPLQPQMAHRIDAFFYHRYERTVRKNATVSWEGMSFEVLHGLVGQKVELIVNPHTKTALRIESKAGEDLGAVVPLDLSANLNRKRQRPNTCEDNPAQKQDEYAVEDVYRDFVDTCEIPMSGTVEEKQ